MADTSPVIIRRCTRKVGGSPADMLEVEHRDTGEILAKCFMGDDMGVERIADLLSSKRLAKEAEQVRQLMMQARKPVRR